jgi:hypothetical protein
MKAIDRLTEAYAAAQAGRHEEALNEYIWFHEHALAEARSLRGVRLSFALAYWKELGEVYPPAMDALLALRDRKVAILAAGVEEWELFNDVSALNDTLGHPRNTYDLFRHINDRSPDFADHCIGVAMPSVVACEDFELARRFMGEPDEVIAQRIEQLNEDVVSAKQRPDAEKRDRILDAYAQLTAEDLLLVVTVLRHTNSEAQAQELLTAALQAVDDPEVRTAVSTRVGARGKT